jgi:TatA/E family protein of Tat protein translocase
MFGSIGGPELLVIFVIALLIFGPKKLSELGRTLGKGVAEFRKAATDLRDTLDSEVARSESAPPMEKAPVLPPTHPDDAQGAAAATDATTRDERT